MGKKREAHSNSIPDEPLPHRPTATPQLKKEQQYLNTFILPLYLNIKNSLLDYE
jgi:hypothetical protein